MSSLYVDSSVITAIAFGESGARKLIQRLRAAERLFSSPLLEAEVRSAARREGQALDDGWLSALTWVTPSRPLSREVVRVLEQGYVRGADCWHLATALYLAPNPGQLGFLTVDARQRTVAAGLGFKT